MSAGGCRRRGNCGRALRPHFKPHLARAAECAAAAGCPPAVHFKKKRGSLRDLQTADNAISADGVRALAALMASNASLTSLDLSGAQRIAAQRVSCEDAYICKE